MGVIGQGENCVLQPVIFSGLAILGSGDRMAKIGEQPIDDGCSTYFRRENPCDIFQHKDRGAVFDDYSQVGFVQEMFFVLRIPFRIDRNDAGSAHGGVCLAGRPADEDPIFCAIEALLDALVNLLG